MRKFFHNGKARLSFALERDEESGKTDIAFAFCSPKDNFNKQTARIKLNGRLDSKNQKFHLGELSFNEYMQLFKKLITHTYELKDHNGYSRVQMMHYFTPFCTVEA